MDPSSLSHALTRKRGEKLIRKECAGKRALAQAHVVWLVNRKKRQEDDNVCLMNANEVNLNEIIFKYLCHNGCLWGTKKRFLLHFNTNFYVQHWVSFSLPVNLNIHAGNFPVHFLHDLYAATGISPRVTQGRRVSNKNNILCPGLSVTPWILEKMI